MYVCVHAFIHTGMCGDHNVDMFLILYVYRHPTQGKITVFDRMNIDWC